jgi:hypothetical protein
MSVAGILSSGLFNYAAQSVNNNVQQFRQEFQQLGQDLQSGNLSAAQTDFATLQQSQAQSSSSAQSNSYRPGFQTAFAGSAIRECSDSPAGLREDSAGFAESGGARPRPSSSRWWRGRGERSEPAVAGAWAGAAIGELVVRAAVLHRLAAGLPANHLEQWSIPDVVSTPSEYLLGKRIGADVPRRSRNGGLGSRWSGNN